MQEDPKALQYRECRAANLGVKTIVLGDARYLGTSSFWVIEVEALPKPHIILIPQRSLGCPYFQKFYGSFQKSGSPFWAHSNRISHLKGLKMRPRILMKAPSKIVP